MLTMLFASAFAAVFWLIAAAWYLLCVVGNWRIFNKFGVEGWKSLIPFYNSYVELSCTWTGTIAIAYVVLGLATGLFQNMDPDTTSGFLVMIGGVVALAYTLMRAVSCEKLSRAFGHGMGFAFGLFFLSPVFRIMLGMGPEQYLGNPTTGSYY